MKAAGRIAWGCNAGGLSALVAGCVQSDNASGRLTNRRQALTFIRWSQSKVKLKLRAHHLRIVRVQIR